MTKATSILLLIALVVLASARSEYKVVNTVKNTTSITLTLSYTGTQDYHIKTNNPIIKTLNFHYQTHTFFDFSFKIKDSNNNRFEIFKGGVFPVDPEENFTFPIANSGVSFEYTESPFDFRIVRKQNGAVIFSTYEQQIIFSDHYIEIGTEVDSDYIYGIG
jgi:alpha-glucosidase